MENWFNLPERKYKATVYVFSKRLPPEEVLEAAEIARAKIPQGGTDAFKYFCGVCHGKLREQKERLSWDYPEKSWGKN